MMKSFHLKGGKRPKVILPTSYHLSAVNRLQPSTIRCQDMYKYIDRNSCVRRAALSVCGGESIRNWSGKVDLHVSRRVMRAWIGLDMPSFSRRQRGVEGSCIRPRMRHRARVVDLRQGAKVGQSGWMAGGRLGSAQGQNGWGIRAISSVPGWRGVSVSQSLYASQGLCVML